MSHTSPFRAVDAAEELISNAETLVSWNKIGNRSRLLERVISHVRGLWLMVAGMQGAMTKFGIWTVVAIFAAAIVLKAGAEFGISDDSGRNQFFWLLITVTTICFIFSAPSRLLHENVSDDLASTLLRSCEALGHADQSEVEIVKTLIEFSEKIYTRRLTTLWFLPATGWASAAFLLRQGLQSGFNSVLGYALAVAVVSLLAAGAIAAYSRAVWAIFGLTSAALALRKWELERQVLIAKNHHPQSWNPV